MLRLDMENKKPLWVKHLKDWGLMPVQLAEQLDCSVSVVVKAYNGDEDAFSSLLDGTASKSMKSILHPSLTGPFEKISTNRRKRPKWMSREDHKHMTKDIYQELET